jgi:uncharacterized UPF0146 family protein
VREETLAALTARLTEYDSIVEIGIGRRPALARELAEDGVSVTATDIQPRQTPASVQFICDDVTDPTLPVYAGTEAIVACNLPPELHNPTARLATRVEAAFLFTTLGGDPPTVSVRRETLPGETLFVYRDLETGSRNGLE